MKATLLIVILFLSLGCSRDGEPEEPLKTYLSQGTWIVQSYELNDEDFTDQFAEVTLKFNKNGAVAFSQNNTATNGNWNYRYESVPDTWYASRLYFSINFNSNETAMLLNQEWNTSSVGTDNVSGNNSQSKITIIKIE